MLKVPVHWIVLTPVDVFTVPVPLVKRTFWPRKNALVAVTTLPAPSRFRLVQLTAPELPIGT